MTAEQLKRKGQLGMKENAKIWQVTGNPALNRKQG